MKPPDSLPPEPKSLVPASVNGEGVQIFLTALEATVGDRTFARWFEGRTDVRLRAGQLRLCVASSFQLAWMQRRFAAVVQSCARSSLGAVEVVWKIDPSIRSDSADAKQTDPISTDRRDAETGFAPDSSAPAPASSSGIAATRQQTSLFDRDEAAARTISHESRLFSDLGDFITGRCNELAFTASRHVAEAPGEQYNPLYLHGGVGTGKTHLSEGIYREIRRRDRSQRIVFMTSEHFANQFTSALRSHALPGFRQRFRSVDVLIVDDISFFGGKRAIQEEFLHTTRQLLSHGRQLVVTSDVHPRLLNGVCSELTSRFLAGLVCRLEAPDLETRKRFVRHRAVPKSDAFPEQLLDYVARRFAGSIRELEGAMKTLESWHAMTGRPVLLEAGRQILSDLERDCIRTVRLPEIEEAVCRLFGLASNDLKSSRRTKAISQPRMLAMFLARRHTQSAYKEIGDYFGGRNHSTVISAEKKVESWLQSSDEIVIGGQAWSTADIVESLERQLQAG